MSTPIQSAPTDDILSWTNQDSRESVLFNSWGVLYRFQVCVLFVDLVFDESIDLAPCRRSLVKMGNL